jgi:hypothetical protein
VKVTTKTTHISASIEHVERLVEQGILHVLPLAMLFQQIIERFDCQGIQGGIIFDRQHFQRPPAISIDPDQYRRSVTLRA